MAQFQEDNLKQCEGELISAIMSILMTVAAVVVIYVMNSVFPNADEYNRILVCMPGMFLLVMAMWFLVKPAKVEF